MVNEFEDLYNIMRFESNRISRNTKSIW